MISAATPGNSLAQTRRNKEVIFYDHIDDSADHHPALHSGGLSDGPVLTGGRDRFSGRRRAGGCAGRLCGRPLHGHGDFARPQHPHGHPGQLCGRIRVRPVRHLCHRQHHVLYHFSHRRLHLHLDRAEAVPLSADKKRLTLVLDAVLFYRYIEDTPCAAV